jgi:hypothetical protein
MKREKGEKRYQDFLVEWQGINGETEFDEFLNEHDAERFAAIVHGEISAIDCGMILGTRIA